MQSFEVEHASWQKPNLQTSCPLQSLSSTHPWATPDGAGVLLQLADAMTAPSTAGKPRIEAAPTHPNLAFVAAFENRFEFIVTTLGSVRDSLPQSTVRARSQEARSLFEP
jgi:hypothetical protein